MVVLCVVIPAYAGIQGVLYHKASPDNIHQDEPKNGRNPSQDAPQKHQA
ncbi:MAG: hypothetical protein WCW40_09920 [Bacteroidota bacterium]